MYRILVVEDEPMIRKGLEKLIHLACKGKAEIESAANGEEALSRIKALRPDFVFTDVRMPRMDGLELCRRIRELQYDIDIVVVSGYSDFEYAQKCVSYGVKEYILKPVTRTGIAEAVQKLIDGAQARRKASFISFEEQAEWAEQLEDALWHLNASERDRTLAHLKDYCVKHSFHAVQLGQLLQELIQRIVKLLNRRDVYTFPEQGATVSVDERSPEEVFEWFEQQLEEIARQIRTKRRGHVKDPVEEVKAYIEQNLSKELSLEEVAERLGLNPSYFSQLFKQMTDETFVQYRIKRRMERAKKLLALPHYKITDISHEVGYSDHPYFTKTFKKVTGLTPSEYREMLGID
ncbi:response regulator transcription factor [Paenibacillus soyae]|uniref:Response regulator n=1 Tax=Paenibacillus soyae TaxID=2969249 RepID=A0A9X2MN39_9BACL|nr:response regulator [Paenibacillus soyae]MCR2802696.1 response regulator [Paenibacillus soyae]